MFTLGRVKRVLYFYLLSFLFVLFFIIPLYFYQFSIFNYFLINLLYFVSNLIKIFLFCIGIKRYDKDKYFLNYININNLNYINCNINNNINNDINNNIVNNNKELPIYSILLPLRHEKEFVIRNLLTSIFNFDYDINKLDIKIIVDEDDKSTIEIVKKLIKEFNNKIINLNKNVLNIVIIPILNVISKPASCNYALKYVKGKYITIYDAEDKPEKYQLKKVINKFNILDKTDDSYMCIQASLNYYNKYDNFLTYCFSVEYSMWFDFTINSITKYATFFPLGGTSNHFKTDKLLEIGGWDSYNVTEDAEIAVRIVKAGYKVSTINSITEEESPITIKAWLKQRTRWIKGFIQTFCEHTILSKPIGIKSNIKFKKIFQLQIADIIIYFTFIMMSFLFFILLIAEIFNYTILSHLQLHSQLQNIKYLNYLTTFNMISLIFIVYISSIIIIYKNKLKFKLIYFILSPLYWTLHYIASTNAIIDIITNTFYWSKTEHGVTKKGRNR